MFNRLSKLFGDPNQREVKSYQSLVESINDLESALEQKTDAQLKEESLTLRDEIRSQVAKAREQIVGDGDFQLRAKEVSKEVDRILEPHLPKAFALVREASKRTTGMRHFDVQLIGGAVLHNGQIAEMQTGEGKTLVASLALYLNALAGLGAQLVTVNDYLARRDAGWMGAIYNALGLTVSAIGPEFSYFYDSDFNNEETDDRLKHFRPVTRVEAYGADITYGTNNEFGFDYLRDNMAQSPDQLVQRVLAYAIVDEVDSILIDEARTPLIISAPSAESAHFYDQFAEFATKLKIGSEDVQQESREKSPTGDYTIDEKGKTVSITEAGIKKLEQLAGVPNLYDPANVRLVHHADVALRAYAHYKKNRDYVVKDGEIIIVDEFTGRMLVGRRYSGGLHQAIEAKEKVPVKEESITLATVTFQNLFRLYGKLAGMTGTAATEAEELEKIYKLEVVSIPTNRPCVRADRQDLIYKTENAKYTAVAMLAGELQEQGTPVLIGTVSIAKSERLSKVMKAKGVKHVVLNAKHHQKEGQIVEQAGQPGSVTVATNMAGRGVDIILGGKKPSESSTKENFKDWEEQNRSVIENGGLFVIGTERHESRRIDNQLRGRGGRQGDPGISQFFLSMEDDLMRIFGGDRMKGLMDRLKIPEDTSINNKLLSRAVEQAQTRVEGHNFDIRKQLVEYDDVMNKHREAIYRRRRAILSVKDADSARPMMEEFFNSMTDEERQKYDEHVKTYANDLRYQIVRAVSLRAIDVLWVEHLQTMEDLRESIGLRGYAQREPIVEYKQEALRLFTLLEENIRAQVIDMLLKIEVQPQEPIEQEAPVQKNLVLSGPADPMGSVEREKVTTGNSNGKVGRNDPCPCGAIDPTTGKVYKFKKCGLINAAHHRG